MFTKEKTDFRKPLNPTKKFSNEAAIDFKNEIQAAMNFIDSFENVHIGIISLENDISRNRALAAGAALK